MPNRTKKPSGYILYEGPSMIDGAPIFVVALTGSRNTKTGSMVQTYIMRSDIDPREASKTGADFSICGTCPHRGKPTSDPDRKQAVDRSCYVLLGQGPRMVYQSYKAGQYGHATTHMPMVDLGRDRMVRLGSYGDPAAVPGFIWESLLWEAKGHTGYSHQSETDGADFRHDLTMASADTLADAQAYWAAGIRTFRVLSDVSEVQQSEVLCPASEEAGRRTQCHDCGLCVGTSIQAKSIAIVAHGAGKNHVARNIQ